MLLDSGLMTEEEWATPCRARPYLGYRDTLYPEYRKKIKDTYVPPPLCKADCGVVGNFVRQRGP